MPRFTGVSALGILSAILLGCSNQAVNIDQSNSSLNAGLLAGQLPPLPSARQASVQMDFTQLGQEATLREPSAVDEGTSLRLASAPGAICWGVWGFSNGPDALECLVDFNGEAGAEAYFAISDYAKGVWKISGPLAGPQQYITINDPRYSNGNGDIYIAVIAYDGASVLVDQLALTVDISSVQTTIDNSGGFTSLALVNGKPAISYYDAADQNLRYVRATDKFGSAWGTPLTLDSTGDTGQWTSLKVVDGNPAISYYDFTNKDLRYIRALDVNGATWAPPVTVDGVPAVGEYCSLDIVAGNPAISYYDYDGPELRYARALDTTGATWSPPVTVDNDGNTGQYTSLEVVSDDFGSYPAISYRNGGASQLRYVRATDAEGTTWATPSVLDGINNTGFNSSLTLVYGIPAVCYYDGTAGQLRYIKATDQLGDNWGTALTLDGLTEDAGAYCALAMIRGCPAITYYNGLHGDLRFISSLDSVGEAWGSNVLLDESSNVIGQDTSLIEVYGRAAVSYYDQTNGKLRYMWGF